MPLKKRKPASIVKKAKERLKGMLKIDIKHKRVIDYGGYSNPLTSNDIKEQIKLCINANNEYNKSLTIADEKSMILKNSEKKLSDMYSRILSGCFGIFGGDAEEITLLGGTRRSERKRPFRKKGK